MSESVMGEWKVVRESRGESVEEQLLLIDGDLYLLNTRCSLRCNT